MNRYSFMHVRQGGRGAGARPVRIAPVPLRTRMIEALGELVDVCQQISIKGVVISLMLLSVLLLSAIGVVYSSHLSRQLFAEQAVLLEKNDQLQLEWAQLLLEQSAWSAPNRIESVASDELHMIAPEVERIELLY